VLALAFAAIFALLELACRVVMPLLPAVGVDALLVGLVPGTIVGARLRSVFFVFGIALLAALVALVLRTHGMSPWERVRTGAAKARSRAIRGREMDCGSLVRVQRPIVAGPSGSRLARAPAGAPWHTIDRYALVFYLRYIVNR